ncbi:MAG: hypothetical protein ACKOE6_06185 [Flammeovirgaceae bacterium]
MQNKWRFFCALVAVVWSFYANGQENTKGDRATEQFAETATKTTAIPLTRAQKRRHRLLFKKPNVKHTARYEYYKRMELVAKEKQKMLRMMAKPQYSDFAYFGHKRKPKRHLPFAMRYCKECGIRH